MLKAVIDTNVIVAALLSRHLDSATRKVLSAIIDGKAEALVSNEILAEYREVLARAKFKLDPLSEPDARLVTGNLKHYPSTPIVVTPAQFCELLGI